LPPGASAATWSTMSSNGISSTWTGMPVSSVNWMASPDSTLARTLSAQTVRVPSTAPGGAEGVTTGLAVGGGVSVAGGVGVVEAVGDGDGDSEGDGGGDAEGVERSAVGDALGVDVGVEDGGGTGAAQAAVSAATSRNEDFDIKCMASGF
jgi:hypothetical protein